MADLFKHFADLAVLSFHKCQFIPGIVALADKAHFGRRSPHAFYTLLVPVILLIPVTLLIPVIPSGGVEFASEFDTGVEGPAFGSCTAPRASLKSVFSRYRQPAPDFFETSLVRRARNFHHINFRHVR